MESNQIKYIDVINLGFKEQIENDKVYFEEHGYEWAIVQLKISKTLYLDWEKDTKLCQLVRCDKKEQNIKGRMAVNGLEHLKQLIEFYVKDSSSRNPIDTKANQKEIINTSSFPKAC